jgi:hypothetical protein
MSCGSLRHFAFLGIRRRAFVADYDLLTAGMGMAPLLGQGAAPGYADPLKPNATEIRRAAIYSKGDPNSGDGTLFGPNIGSDGKPVADARIAGEEILAMRMTAAVRRTSR